MSELEWMRIFGNNLVYHMQSADMTQEELARATGLTQASISRYASGTQLPGIRAVINISNALGLTTDELIDFGDIIHQ
jgi:transcriptional regulator with XRE-family HTH domain